MFYTLSNDLGFFVFVAVWMEVMLPQLNVKHLTKYSVSYLENLLR